ncbi:MAG TPA: hypothetical protein VFU53_12485, partial [Burkholderiales bacterium]|nr:hypothetical protein [Burkholderiales bacterium]
MIGSIWNAYIATSRQMAPQRRAAAHAPHLAVHPRPPFALVVLDDLARSPEQLLAAADHRPGARLQRHAEHQQHERRAAGGQARDQGPGDVVARYVGVDQHDRPHHERDRPAHAERAVGGDEQLRHHETQSQRDQRQAGVVDRQHLERVHRHQQADSADHAGEDHAGVVELEQQAVDPDQHQDVGDAGVGDHAQQAAAPVGVQAHQLGALGPQRTLAALQL